MSAAKVKGKSAAVRQVRFPFSVADADRLRAMAKAEDRTLSGYVKAVVRAALNTPEAMATEFPIPKRPGTDLSIDFPESLVAEIRGLREPPVLLTRFVVWALLRSLGKQR